MDLARLGMGLNAIGTSLRGGDGMAMVESQKRKAQIDSLMDRMGIAGPKRDILASMPVNAQAEQLWEMLNPQSVEGKVMGDRLVNPYTGEAIADYSPKPIDMSQIFGSPQGQAIKSGLMARGIPGHVADGFLVNMNDESGLNPGINEANPTVPGSRGGFGLAQWTGPRRVALERFAAAQGKPVSDMNVQLDFLAQELMTTESGAGRSIMTSPDAETAANRVLTEYLRPAPQHQDARAAKYAGLDRKITQMTQVLASGKGTPAQREAIEFQRKRLMAEQEALSETDKSPIAALEARAEQAGLRPGTPEYQQFMLDGGRAGGFVVESDGQGGFRVATGAAAGKPGAKLTERQSQLALFGSMMDKTMPVINELEKAFDPANLKDNIAARGGWAGNYFTSDQMQKYNTAAAAWAEGVLRIQTGAAATKEEIERVVRTYFAQPGNSPETVQYKKELREDYAQSLGIASGGIITPSSAKKPTADIPPPPSGFSVEEWGTYWDAMPEEDKDLFR